MGKGRRLLLMLTAGLALALAAACAGDEGAAPAAVTLLQPGPATPTPSPTPTAIPLPTATPTPTPPPAQALGHLPVGQVLFSVAEAGGDGLSLWRLPTGGALVQTAQGLAADGWGCIGGAEAACVLVSADGALTLAGPDGSPLALLDYLAPPSDGLNRTDAPTVTLPFTITAAAVALAPSGRRAAVAAADGVRVYDLEPPALAASAWITGSAGVHWSPDGAALAVVAQGEGWQELALWRPEAGDLRLLAHADSVGAVAWAPKGDKLAFDAAYGAGFHDVFVYSPSTGELRNLTELGLRSPDRAGRGLLAAWRPAWEADGEALTYLRGSPADPHDQAVVRQSLKDWRFQVLWPRVEEGLALATTPDGQFQARLAAQGVEQRVQLRPRDGAWQDLALAPQGDVVGLLWDPPSADGHRYLLIVRRRALSLVDTWTGQAWDLATTCPQCTVQRALWLP
ncbi:MAG: hypothetical protein RMN53_08560 [Anaerolineae bacterium]|nr:hypothetical protein [Anaerolineae bacterium]